MTARMGAAAEADLDAAFAHYDSIRPGLGEELLVEFRRAVDRVLQHPAAWQPLDDVYRRYRLHRFPYGIIYRVDELAAAIMIVAVQHLHRRPDTWRGRQ